MKKNKALREQKVDKNNIPELASFLIIVFALLYTAGWSFVTFHLKWDFVPFKMGNWGCKIF